MSPSVAPAAVTARRETARRRLTGLNDIQPSTHWVDAAEAKLVFREIRQHNDWHGHPFSKMDT
jgi:hypothetical protein